MKLVALIVALSFSLVHLSDTYVVENYEKDTREVFVSHSSLDKQQANQSTENQTHLVKVEESPFFLYYNYIPVTKYLFIKIRTLLL
ncbi:hypothetical protein [Pleomorphovibrio marinus]|uniref:hypothetical protein n=1 Tax=Pleomorphovibrio marinus TaxID=2164132 RepID=UPI000E0A4FAF|nr:hypothetical protein [Pleomorphovibrio marinus]